MAEPGGVPPPIPTPGGGIVRAGTVETQPQGHLPLLYEGTPLHVRSTLLNRLGAALRSNALGDIFDTPSGPTRVDQSFDPVAAANATSFAEDREWLSRARNQEEFDIMVNHAQLRRRDRAIAAENPVTHFLFQAVLDPTNVITAGNAWTRAGATVAQRFLRGAAVNAITMGSAEMLRDAVDPATSLSDSLQSVVGAALFGGLIGSIPRGTRPSNVALGRYIDGVRVNAADLANDIGPNHIRGDRLPGELIPGEGAIARTTLRAAGERAAPAATAAERAALGGEEPPIVTGRGKLADDLAAADAAEARRMARAPGEEPPPAAVSADEPRAAAPSTAAAPHAIDPAAAAAAPPTIGRIAPTNDWGSNGSEMTLGPRRAEAAAGSAGAAGTPVHMVGQTGEWQPLPTGVTRLTPGGIKLERLGMTPVMRLLTSPIDAAGAAIAALAEIPFRIKRNLEGKANPANVQGDQRYWQQRLAHANRDFEEALADHRGVGRAFISAQELAGTTPQGKVSVAEFNDRVWRRLHGQTDDTIPQVNRAAASFRKLYDELGDEAAKHGFFDPNTVRTPKVWQTTAGDITENYVNRVWNTKLIQENLQAFTQHVEHWLTISGGDVRRAREIVDGILTDRPFRAIDDEHVGQATSAYKRAFDAPSTQFSRWLVTDPQELMSHYTRTMGTDVSLVKRTGIGGERGAINLRPLLDNVREEWLRDIGNRSGLDPKLTQGVSDTLTTELKRIGETIQLDYKQLNDLAAAYGGVPSLSAIAAVRERGIALKNAAMDLAKTSLRASDGDWNHMLADMEDLRASRDILRGTYGQWDESMDWIPRVLASARKVAMMTGLTGVVSQLSDVGALVLKEGMTRTFGTAVALLRSDLATLKMVGKEAQEAGTMLDMMLSGKVMAMHDLAPDLTGRHTMFERVLNKATEASFYVNLMNPWSAMMKGWASLAIGNRILDDVHKVSGQAMRGMDIHGKVIPGGMIAQHAAIDARLDEIRQIIDGRRVGAPMATVTQAAPLHAEAQRLIASKQVLGPLSAAEKLAARVEQERILSTTPTLFLNGRTSVLGYAPDIPTLQAQLDKHIAGHEGAMARLAQAGIDPDMATQISAQHGAHGSTPDGRVFLPNTQMWSHADARDAFRRALSFDVENSVISADKLGRSLWLSKPMGQTIGMFHAYGQATIQKLMIPALQNMDINTLSGVALMVGAGIVSDQLRRMMTDNKQPQSASQALVAGIDRSGIWGWFGNLFNAAQSMHDTRFGPSFAGQPTVPSSGTPYGLGAMRPDGLVRALGPVAGRTRDLADLTFRTATMDWGNATARDARRLLPLNNVTHLHFAFTELEHMLAGRGDMEAAVRHDTRPRRSWQNNSNDSAAAAAAFMRQRELAQQQPTGTIAGPPPAQQAAPMPRRPQAQRTATASQMRGPPPAAAPTPY